VFVSFKYGEEEWLNNLRQMFQAWGGEAQASPLIVAPPPAPTSEKAIRELLVGRIKDCVGLIFLVGDKSRSEWIEYEVQVAASAGLPYCGIRHPQASGPLPRGFENVETLQWEQRAVRDWVARLK